MKLFILYQNEKKEIDINKYSSVHSLLNNYCEIKNIDKDDYYLEYQGKILSNNDAIDKYYIQDSDTLTINPKIKGGKSSFMKFAKKHPVLVIFALIISILPIFLLKIGYLPVLSVLIKTILDRSSDSLFQYLICHMGKITLVKRFRTIITIFKFVIFILIVFVMITLPLTIYCITLNGHELFDNPKSMCKPLKQGNEAGMIITMIYFVFYMMFRGFDKVIGMFLSVTNKYYLTSMLISPILKFIRKLYSYFKYFIVPSLLPYMFFLDRFVQTTSIMLNQIAQFGCGNSLSKMRGKMMADFEKMEKNEKNKELSASKEEQKGGGEYVDPLQYPMCKEKKEKMECCSIKNTKNIADTLFDMLNNDILSKRLKKSNTFTSAAIIVEGLYDNIINEYPKEESEKIMDEVNNKIKKIEELVIEFAAEEKIEYNPAKYELTKKILKVVFGGAFCNVMTTTKSLSEVLIQMGDVDEVTDMLKAGAATGSITSFVYLLAIIIILIMNIFKF